MGKGKNDNLATMTPEQIRERGRELLRLAQQKETEIKQRQMLRIGEIFQREIKCGWPTDWAALAEELEGVVGSKVELPAWGVQGGGSAPLVTVEGGEDDYQSN